MGDHYKNNAIFCLAGAALSTFGHVLLILGGQGIIPMVPVDENCISDMCEMKTSFALLLSANIILGIGYCMVASSIWTLLSYTVTADDANIAYGRIQSMQHVGFILAGKVSAELISGINPKIEYFHSEIFYSAMFVLSMITIGLFIIFYGGGSRALFSDSYRRL